VAVEDYTTRVELMAIPIVALVFGVGVVLVLAGTAGTLGIVLAVVGGIALVGLLVYLYAHRHPHPAVAAPAPRVGAPGHAVDDDRFRVLVIADESCVDPALVSQLTLHGGGRSVEALVIAPAIGSWISRWTGDESSHTAARRHLDDTVSALAQVGITARGEIGADDPLQAADDGLREFEADEIVFVTQTGTKTDWVERGVIDAARDRYHLRVVHIELPCD
jgi:hypothetical protein